MLILNVTPKSAAGLVTFALEDIQVGDRVEMFRAASGAAAGAEPMNPPLSVHRPCRRQCMWEKPPTIICDANSPHNRPLHCRSVRRAASFCRATTLPGWDTRNCNLEP